MAKGMSMASSGATFENAFRLVISVKCYPELKGMLYGLIEVLKASQTQPADDEKLRVDTLNLIYSTPIL